MADMKRDAGLRTIFSFFLGLMLTAFVGVGVYTFHPPPEQFERQLRDITAREDAIRQGRSSGDLTTADRDQVQELERQRRELLDAATEARKPWGRTTSVIVIVFATLAMVVSLGRADQLPVISNGLLLGGLFTMLYGVGWIVATDTSVARFLVITAALAITLGLGYVRFVRRGRSVPVGGLPSMPNTDGIAQLEQRLGDLEARLNEAAQALGRTGGGSISS